MNLFHKILFLVHRKIFSHKTKFTADLNPEGLIAGLFTYGEPKLYKTPKYNVYVGKLCSLADNLRIIEDGNQSSDIPYPSEN